MFARKKIVAATMVVMVTVLWGIGFSPFCGIGSSAEKVVRVLIRAGSHGDHLFEHAGDFEKATGIKAQVDIATRQTIDEKVMRELIEQRGNYDVVMIADYTTFVTKSEYIPIEDYLSKEEVAQFYARSTYTDPRTGKMAGVPQCHNFQMLWYRKDLLEDSKEQAAFEKRYGRKLTVPTTPQELSEVAEFFHRPPDTYGYFVSGVDWSWGLEYQYFLFGQGEDFADEEGNLMLNTPGAIKAMEDLVKLAKFAPMGWEMMSFFDGDELMREGKIALFQNWTSNWKLYVENHPEIGIAPPVGDVEPGVYLSGYVGLIPKKAPNPDLGVEYLKWMGGYDYQKVLTMDTLGNLPARSDVIKDPDVRAGNPGIEQLEKALSYGHVARCTWENELFAGLYEIFFQVLDGKMTAAEGMNWLQNVKFAGRRAIE